MNAAIKNQGFIARTVIIKFKKTRGYSIESVIIKLMAKSKIPMSPENLLIITPINIIKDNKKKENK